MQYLKLTLSPTDRVVHTIDSFVASREEADRDAIMHVDSRADGTAVLLYRLIGDKDSFEQALEEHEAVLDHEVIDVDGEGFHAFIQADNGDFGGKLLEIAHRNALIIDTPLEFVEDGVRATLVGTHENLRESLSEMPADVTFTVDNAGRYVPGGEDLLSPLTDRQLEVFETAVEEGYYDVPRRATHKDIADNLGCAPSTVDEHLRKAESRVVSALTQ